MTKKGQVMQNLGALGVGIATLAIILTIAFVMVANVKTQINDVDGGERIGCNATSNLACSSGYNATSTLQTAAEGVPGWVPLIVIVAIGGIILGLVSAFKK